MDNQNQLKLLNQPSTLSILDSLSEAEKKEALKILNELVDKGSSDTLNKLVLDDYKELPVDIDTFLHDTDYLGQGLIDDAGRFTVFPY